MATTTQSSIVGPTQAVRDEPVVANQGPIVIETSQEQPPDGSMMDEASEVDTGRSDTGDDSLTEDEDRLANYDLSGLSGWIAPVGTAARVSSTMGAGAPGPEPTVAAIPPTARVGEAKSYASAVALLLELPFPLQAAVHSEKVMAISYSHFEAIFITALTAEVNRELMRAALEWGLEATETTRGYVTRRCAEEYGDSSGLLTAADLNRLLDGAGWGSTATGDGGRTVMLAKVRTMARTIVTTGVARLHTIEGIDQCWIGCEMNMSDLVRASTEVLYQSGVKLTFSIVDVWGQGNPDGFAQIHKVRLYDRLKLYP
jgi:hypothetical protein